MHMGTTFHYFQRKNTPKGINNCYINQQITTILVTQTEHVSVKYICLTSHSITSMGHACLVENLYILYYIFLQGSHSTWSFFKPVQGVSNFELHAGLSLSMHSIHKITYNVFWLYSSSYTSHIRGQLLTLETITRKYDII